MKLWLPFLQEIEENYVVMKIVVTGFFYVGVLQDASKCFIAFKNAITRDALVVASTPTTFTSQMSGIRKKKWYVRNQLKRSGWERHMCASEFLIDKTQPKILCKKINAQAFVVHYAWLANSYYNLVHAFRRHSFGLLIKNCTKKLIQNRTFETPKTPLKMLLSTFLFEHLRSQYALGPLLFSTGNSKLHICLSHPDFFVRWEIHMCLSHPDRFNC